MIIYLILSLLLIIADQLVKAWVVANFALGGGTSLLPGVVNILYLQNRGAAWGIFAGSFAFFYAITAVAVIGVLYLMWKERGKSPLIMASYALILAGAIGNFIDRFRLGYVVDMFQVTFIDFPIFNVADICLTIGVALLFVYILFIDGRKVTK